MVWIPKEEEIVAVLQLDGPARYEYWIKKVADQQEIWSLWQQGGWALAGDDAGRILAPVWPHAKYASLCATGLWKGYVPKLRSCTSLGIDRQHSWALHPRSSLARRRAPSAQCPQHPSDSKLRAAAALRAVKEDQPMSRSPAENDAPTMIIPRGLQIEIDHIRLTQARSHGAQNDDWPGTTGAVPGQSHFRASADYFLSSA